MNALQWKRAIVDLVVTRQQIDEVDMDHVFEYPLPRVAAEPEALARVEARFGASLDPKHRAFLEHAGGWPSFHHSADLFGVDDLLGATQVSRRADELLELLDEEGTLGMSGFRRPDVLPICVAREDMDVFVMCRDGTLNAGAVIWFASQEIERFPDFDAFFLAIVELHRRRLRRLKEQFLEWIRHSN
jgi:hypothetical protein